MSWVNGYILANEIQHHTPDFLFICGVSCVAWLICKYFCQYFKKVKPFYLCAHKERFCLLQKQVMKKASESYEVLCVLYASKKQAWWRRVIEKQTELKSPLHLFYHMDEGNGEDGQACRFLSASIKTSFALLTWSLRRFSQSHFLLLSTAFHGLAFS